MGRPPRAAAGGLIYHALNRANARRTIFEDRGDYGAFLGVLAEALAGHPTRLLADCIMPTHFHLVLWPRADGELSDFMRWLTLTHTQRWHAHLRSAGTGHLYQGRFKAFPVEGDEHFLTVCRYVERNALRAGLVARAEDWPWGSLHQWCGEGSRRSPAEAVPSLSAWPMRRPPKWVERVNAALSAEEEAAVRRSMERSQPFGRSAWQSATAARLGLESTLRPRGRPRKERDNGP
ncbi:MAG: transposase [Isosphaeraceae bacterium]|nr:transposase [Isosphaeraceae bacterium]